MISLAGMNPVTFLTTEDPLLAETMAAVAQRRLELAADERQDLAVRTGNALAEALSGG